eukprot:scaffold11478_cov103-Isochrysis_galbana.AAC.1
MKHRSAINRVRINEMQQSYEDRASSGLGENVGQHVCTLNMAKHDKTLGNKIAKESSSSKNVLGSKDILTADLESEKTWDGPRGTMPRSTKRSRMKTTSLAASIAPKNSASALDKEHSQWQWEP